MYKFYRCALEVLLIVLKVHGYKVHWVALLPAIDQWWAILFFVYPAKVDQCTMLYLAISLLAFVYFSICWKIDLQTLEYCKTIDAWEPTKRSNGNGKTAAWIFSRFDQHEVQHISFLLKRQVGARMLWSYIKWSRVSTCNRSYMVLINFTHRGSKTFPSVQTDL